MFESSGAVAPPVSGEPGGAFDRLTPGTTFADAVHRLLAVARTQVGMQVAWVSEFVGTDQVLRFVDCEPGADAPQAGAVLPLGGSFCARVLDGRFPTIIPDAHGVPEAALLDVTLELHIGSYIGVPLRSPEGVAVGMLCAVSDTGQPELSDRDVAALTLLAEVLKDLQQRAMSVAEASEQRTRLVGALDAVVSGRGRHAVLQPIVDLATGRPVAAEGLTRFRATPETVAGVGRSPAQWFDAAAKLGRRSDLEMATAASVLDLIETVPAHVDLSINLGPDTIVERCLDELFVDRPVTRVVLEMTEHAAVHDYGRLRDCLEPYRARGLRVAVDDAGAGYASLRHVLAVRPDFVKIDMALVRGADADLARRTLLRSLAAFAAETECLLVAEGVETIGELRAIAACGVPLAQGYVLARPSQQPRWEGYPAAV